MTDKKKPPPPDEYSAFKRLLSKIARVPKHEIDEEEAKYQREREALRKKKGA